MTADLPSLAGLARSLVIYRARPWRARRLAAFYRGIVAPGDLAFDIGAHAGNRTRALLDAGARVVALEPQETFYRFLSRDLPDTVTLVRAAAGRRPGTAGLAVSSLHPTVSSMARNFAGRMAAEPGFRRVRWNRVEQVAVTSLDRLIAEHGLPRFVKIDVEGHEAEVVAGLSRAVPWLAFEALAASAEETRGAVAHLAALGPYRFSAVIGESVRFALPWLDPAALPEALARAAAGRPADVYARLPDQSP